MGGRSAIVVALALLAFPLAGVAQARERADAEQWQRRLGHQGVVQVDSRTGTPRMLTRLDGPLTKPSARGPRAVARDFVRSNAAKLGLARVDGEPRVRALPGGISRVEWRQSAGGIPSDSSLRVDVAGDGAVLSVNGAPEAELDVDPSTAISAGAALRAVQDAVGVHRSLVARSGPSGARRTTDYGDDTTASLVVHQGRLAWRVRYRAGAAAVYDATVDAEHGKVLRRANMVKSDAPALVYARYPGAAPPFEVDFEALSWLTSAATTLNGPNAHVFSDLNDNDAVDAGEEIERTDGGFRFPFQAVAGASCDETHLCSWSGSNDVMRNRDQDGAQAFYFANRFHDHLASLGFDAGAGSFDGDDPLQLQTLDGAATGPDAAHDNNANMFTPPDGEKPQMQMYLWRSPHRNVSSGSDAAILYHEYTHGLSNRLVTDGDGYGALNSPQSGALGEGWSDWYAQDFIVGEFPELDTSEAGEVDMGAYVDFGTARMRSQPLDCPVGGAATICPANGTAGPGGYTYADFGKIATGPEPHADGEIWAQTLWDLRTAVGKEKARELVTVGMGLLPPEPSFLDARNGILLADQERFDGADIDALWGVFAARGMGFFAASTDGDDTAPLASFERPPAPDEPSGTISGVVTDARSGIPVAGVTLGIAGNSAYDAVSGADGRYTISGLPAGTYPKLVAGGGGFDPANASLTVTAGETTTWDPVVRRNWAATAGGAALTATNGNEYVYYGCGPRAALDHSLERGWSTDNDEARKYLVVELPQPIDVTEFVLDPGENCGDPASAATADYSVETSANGTDWEPAAQGTFTSGDRHRRNAVAPTGGVDGVRYVRLTLLSSQGEGARYRDLSEFGVYGTPDAPEVGFASAPPALGREPSPTFAFASSPPGATFECSLDGADFAACTSPLTLGPLADGTHTFAVRAVDGDKIGVPASSTFTIDTTPPIVTLQRDFGATAHAGPLAFAVSTDEPATTTCALDDGAFGSCAVPRSADTLALGEHVFRARAVDGAGNEGTAEATFEVVNSAPRVDLAIAVVVADGDAAPVGDSADAVRPPLGSVSVTPVGHDDDGDTLTYTLDFGDGTAPRTGTLPAGQLSHTYAPGSYRMRVTASDGRASASAERTVIVPQQAPRQDPLSLTLSAPALELGAFIPGVARDYAATLTATTGGPAATLTLSDPGASPGHLVGEAGALAQPLQVRAANGAFTPLTAPVVVGTAIEFRQPIAANETLRKGRYAKPLTLTLAVQSP